MRYASFTVLFLSSVMASSFAQTGRQDYTSELIRLTISFDDKHYREAIDGFKAFCAQPGIPRWLMAGCEYEQAESYAALRDTDNAITALGRAVQLGYDDCITPGSSECLRPILQLPKALQAVTAMKITGADFHELVWLQAEVLHAQHDGRMMVIENTNRLDHAATLVPQAQLPVRATTSAGVLYWRQKLLVRQSMQREFVMRADIIRIRHAATMAALSGVSSSAAFISMQRAAAVAESRTLEVRRRAFVPSVGEPGQPSCCLELMNARPGSPSR